MLMTTPGIGERVIEHLSPWVFIRLPLFGRWGC